MNSDGAINITFHVRKLMLKEGKWLTKAKQWGNRESKPGFLKNKTKQQQEQW